MDSSILQRLSEIWLNHILTISAECIWIRMENIILFKKCEKNRKKAIKQKYRKKKNIDILDRK